MADETLKFVGTYIPYKTYKKFRLQCAKVDVSASKALLGLIVAYTKNITDEEIGIKKEDETVELKKED